MKYTQKKGNRIKSSRYWNAIVHFDDNNDNFWWDETNKIWQRFDKIANFCSTNSCNIKSIRAFRRRLKQWSKQLPKGTRLILINRYTKNDVIGVIR